MKFAVTAGQMRIAEENAAKSGISYYQLMENAGQNCFKYISRIINGAENKNFVILCGRGNNGGDGIIIASEIIKAGGNAVAVYAIDLPESECARKAYSNCQNTVPTALYTHKEEIVQNVIDSCDVVIDCIFGTGFHGELESKLKGLLSYVNKNKSAVKISIDIPTGVNADTGEIAECAFKPDYTLAVAACKKGMLSAECSDFCGKTCIVDIGIPDGCYQGVEGVFTPERFRQKIPVSHMNDHKGSNGKILNISGCVRYNGAAILSSKAALRAGAGLVALATPQRVINAVAPAIPETVFIPLEQDDEGYMDKAAVEQIESELSKYDVVMIGCGIGRSAGSAAVVEYVLKNAKVPVVLDADGLNCAARNPELMKSCPNLTITPHPAEFSRITGMPVNEVQKNRLDAAKTLAAQFNINVLLKGANTVITSPEGKTYINTTGNPSLAKAGSGDVLTGIIASLTAQHVPPFQAAVLGALLHGACADEFIKTRSVHGLLASDVCNLLPLIMR